MPAYDEEDYQQSFSWKTWKRLRPFLKPFRTAFALMVGLNALTGLVDVLLPLMQRYAIANFIEKETLRGLLPYGLVYGAVILIQSLLVVAFCVLLLWRMLRLFFSQDQRIGIAVKILTFPLAGSFIYGMFETMLFTQCADDRANTDFRELFFFLLAGIVLAYSYELAPKKDRKQA